jgi:hypothetical protein
MSGDEVLVLIVALGFAFSCWGVWLVAAVESVRFGRGFGQIAALVLMFVVSLAPVYTTLVTSADPQVQSGNEYIALFLLVAADTLAAVSIAGTRLGLSVLDGVLRQRNASALWAVAGLWVGTGLINAGANVGRGDTIYTTLGPLALALGTFLVLVALLSGLTRGFHAVRIDRDWSSGLRLFGQFVAWGTILGRAVAGDYESARRTVEDLVAYGWPVVLLFVISVPIEWRLRPTVRKPVTSWTPSILWTVAMIIVAAAWAAIR